MALEKDEVMKIVNGFLELVRHKHDVRQAYLFGSFAKGTPKKYGDVDLAIVLGSLGSSEEPLYDEKFKIFHEAPEYNSLLEVVCFRQEEFDQDGGSLVFGPCSYRLSSYVSTCSLRPATCNLRPV